MIDPKELRIGNWVNYMHSDGVCRPNIVMGFMSSYDLKTQYVVEINPPDCFNAYLPDLSPIPLTEQWVKDFGFEYTNNGYFWSIEYEDWEFVIRTFGKGEISDSVSITDDGWDGQIDPECIQYVHQLQNLYFCLCGEELSKQ